ncbi:MAG TPA: serine protease [Caulobacteraceae bacterium]|nr:serine protease [Caulobacteraceae bacterium]
MAVDLSIDLIQATVQVEQPLGNGTRTVGTGFLVSDPTPDGKPRTILVTANHVFAKMPGPIATIGFRIEDADGSWHYDPEPLKIRDGVKELWTHHPDRDVAVIAIQAPPAFVKAAIPEGWLAGDDTFTKEGLTPGDEMLALGFPEGLSANAAGFPILRSGRVASFPLAPTTAFPTFLLDFNVFPGNSGGPVYVDTAPHGPAPADSQTQGGFIAGILTQQVELNSRNLSIGIVTDAKFVRETLQLLDDPDAVKATAQVAEGGAPTPGLISAADAAYSR